MGCRAAGGYDVIQNGRHIVAILDFTENQKLSKKRKNWKFLMLDM